MYIHAALPSLYRRIAINVTIVGPLIVGPHSIARVCAGLTVYFKFTLVFPSYKELDVASC